jgi:hypothetical protein
VWLLPDPDWTVNSAPPLYTMWSALVYGAPFMTYCVLVQRSLRVRSQMARAELERSRWATLVDDARLQALRGRAEPDLVLRALRSVQVTFRVQPVRAQAQLDALVSFLRLAMPAVRSGRTTLRDELGVLDAYRTLRAAVDGGAPVCGDLTAAVADADVRAFPAQLLLPLVDGLHRAGGGSPVELRLRGRHEAELQLDLRVPAALDDVLTPDWRQRLDRAMATLSPRPGRWHAGPSSTLTLGLPPAPSPPKESVHVSRPKLAVP